MQGPLPDILPGALPRLQRLEFSMHDAEASLPASWGSQAEVLPALERLSVSLALPTGQLPAAWARGWRKLQSLVILGGDTELPGTINSLPTEWADGFPALVSFSFYGPRISGTFPSAWVSGFPKLKSL